MRRFEKDRGYSVEKGISLANDKMNIKISLYTEFR
jgi:hypothetical protein